MQMDLPKPLNREIKANDLYSAHTTLLKFLSQPLIMIYPTIAMEKSKPQKLSFMGGWVLVAKMWEA